MPKAKQTKMNTFFQKVNSTGKPSSYSATKRSSVEGDSGKPSSSSSRASSSRAPPDMDCGSHDSMKSLYKAILDGMNQHIYDKAIKDTVLGSLTTKHGNIMQEFIRHWNDSEGISFDLFVQNMKRLHNQIKSMDSMNMLPSSSAGEPSSTPSSSAGK